MKKQFTVLHVQTGFVFNFQVVRTDDLPAVTDAKGVECITLDLCPTGTERISGPMTAREAATFAGISTSSVYRQAAAYAYQKAELAESMSLRD